MKRDRGCADCGWARDRFMVTNEVWREAGYGPREFHCLRCLETRLKRPLTIEDFPAVPINRQAYAAMGRLGEVVAYEQKKEREWQERMDHWDQWDEPIQASLRGSLRPGSTSGTDERDQADAGIPQNREPMERDSGCVDCGHTVCSWDSYTGWKRVWAEAGQPEGFCCLPCLERRLKRPLTLEDFPPVPVNRQAYAAAGKLSMVIEREELEKKQRQARISKERERREWMEKHQLKLF